MKSVCEAAVSGRGPLGSRRSQTQLEVVGRLGGGGEVASQEDFCACLADEEDRTAG